MGGSICWIQKLEERFKRSLKLKVSVKSTDSQERICSSRDIEKKGKSMIISTSTNRVYLLIADMEEK